MAISKKELTFSSNELNKVKNELKRVNEELADYGEALKAKEQQLSEKMDQNKTFIDAFNQCLSYAWDNARDENGLFSTDLTGNNNNEKKWLLTQAAMVEMYSRLAAIQ